MHVYRYLQEGDNAMEFFCKIFGHKWELVEPKQYERHKKCLYRCKRCKHAETMHQWKTVEGRCYEKCAVCGDMKYLPHQFKDGKCVRCGEIAPLPTNLTYEERMANADEGITNGNVRGGW